MPNRWKSSRTQAVASRGAALAAAGVFLAVAAALTLAAWRIQEERERQVAQSTLVVAAQARSHLSAWIDARLALVEQLARHWPDHYAGNPVAFRRDAQLFVERLEGLRAINWVDGDGVIRIVVPEAGNEAASGRKLAEHPRREVREALEQALRRGRATRTPALELLQGGMGFATYWPVRTADGSSDGFVNGVFRIDDLIRVSSLDSDLLQQYRFQLLEPEGAIVWSSEAGPVSGWPLASEHPLRVLDRKWRFVVAPSPALLAGIQPQGWRFGLLTAAYLGTALLAWLVYGHLRRHDTVRRSEHTLRELLDRLPHFVSVKDPEGRFVVANRALADAYGCASEALIGRQQQEFHPQPRELEHMARCEREVLEGAGPVRVDEEPFTDAAGHQRTLATVRVPFRDPRSGRTEVLSVGVDVSDRRQAEELRATLASAMDQAGEAIVVLERRGRIVFANLAFSAMMGTGDRDLRGLSMDAFANPAAGDEDLLAQINEALRAGRTWSGRYTTTWTDGSRHARNASVSPVRDATGRLRAFIGVLRDITSEQRLEEELRQSQKMEAVGRLAGGVAHDFNNLLTVILSCADALRRTLPAASPDHESALMIATAADRAAELTRQLLAFSRRQNLVPKVVDLSDIVRGVAPLLRPMVGAACEIDLQLDRAPVPVEVDPGQIERVILNLCANARDAMSAGGTMTVSTTASDTGRESADTRPELVPGRYAVLTVADTGPGIDPSVLDQIFDPFFTTKDVGAGTGLGLSTVYGIAEQSGGAVQVRSAPGEGTALSLWLPLHGAVTRVTPPQAQPSRSGGNGIGTVLLAEDEPAIRALVTRTLASAGYCVVAARDGLEAIERADSIETLSLLLTDLAMPRMGGLELRERLKARCPDLRVLFMSGFIGDPTTAAGLSPEDPVLEKPFRPQDLLERVRALLD